MKSYIVYSLDSGMYSVYVIGLTYLSILSYVKDVEKECLLRNKQGVLLLDQYLSTGDSDNRFVAINFSHGRINLKSARRVKVNQNIKKLSDLLLRPYKIEIENSILNEDQKNCILYSTEDSV